MAIRQATVTDREFLYELHCRTMRPVIDMTWGWDDEWQAKDFERRCATYDVFVIERDGHPIGGLMLETMADSIYVHEIQVLPEYQEQGVGTAVMKQIIEQASKRGLGVTLSVVAANPRAKDLYARLGFTVTAFESPFFRMRYSPTHLA